jgi:hypothetical protein
MAPLLVDPSVSQFSPLAIQEPFYNFFSNLTHNSSYTSFPLFLPVVEKLRVRFFINKSANPSSWFGDFSSPNKSYLQLKSPVVGARGIMIHNINRPQGTSSIVSTFSHNLYYSSCFSAATDNSDVFSLLYHVLLDVSVQHILLGDFNLHHFLWGGPQAAADPMAWNFISFFKTDFLHLLLPQELIKCSENCRETTRDLVFESTTLKKSLEPFRVRKNLHQRSDHLPILSVFSFVLQSCQFELHPLWKKEDEEAIKAKGKEISSFPRNIACISNIDFSINFLLS